MSPIESKEKLKEPEEELLEQLSLYLAGIRALWGSPSLCVNRKCPEEKH